jgi:hypothetical protein
MRPNRIVCVAFAALNVIVFVIQVIPRNGEELRARVSISAKASTSSEQRGAAVPFRLSGEKPEPAGIPATDPQPKSIVQPIQDQIDSNTFAYLGTMTSPNGSTDIFVKNMVTNRVYSSGGTRSDLKVLGESEKEFLIEINGTKYKVPR